MTATQEIEKMLVDPEDSCDSEGKGFRMTLSAVTNLFLEMKEIADKEVLFRLMSKIQLIPDIDDNEFIGKTETMD